MLWPARRRLVRCTEESWWKLRTTWTVRWRTSRSRLETEELLNWKMFTSEAPKSDSSSCRTCWKMHRCSRKLSEKAGVRDVGNQQFYERRVSLHHKFWLVVDLTTTSFQVSNFWTVRLQSVQTAQKLMKSRGDNRVCLNQGVSVNNVRSCANSSWKRKTHCRRFFARSLIAPHIVWISRWPLSSDNPRRPKFSGANWASSRRPEMFVPKTFVYVARPRRLGTMNFCCHSFLIWNFRQWTGYFSSWLGLASCHSKQIEFVLSKEKSCKIYFKQENLLKIWQNWYNWFHGCQNKENSLLCFF